MVGYYTYVKGKNSQHVITNIRVNLTRTTQSAAIYYFRVNGKIQSQVCKAPHIFLNCTE